MNGRAIRESRAPQYLCQRHITHGTSQSSRSGKTTSSDHPPASRHQFRVATCYPGLLHLAMSEQSSSSPPKFRRRLWRLENS